MTHGLSHVLEERTPGLHRAVVVGRDGKAWHLFQQCFGGAREAVRPGQTVIARVRAKDQSGGVFLDHIGWKRWEGGYEPLFCDRRHSDGLLEGQTLHVRVISAERQDHAARVEPNSTDTPLSYPKTAFVDWIAGLGVTDVRVAEGDAIDQSFDEVELESVALQGGGAIHIERTRALTAIDVDAAGRISKGSAGAKALSLNRAGVEEVARQISLRRLGGAVVIDCVAPLNEGTKDKVRSAFLKAYREMVALKVDALKPSRFGLMEIALPWSDTPVEEISKSAEMQLLLGLRSSAREMAHDAGSLFTLGLRDDVFDAYLSRKTYVDDLIRSKLSGRLTLTKALDGKEGLGRT